MKRALKILAFLVLFTAAAVGVTYVLIQRTLGEPLIRPKVDLPYEEVTPEAGIDLNGFYDQNDLLFEEVVEEIGEVRVTYPQIDGLKDAAVEDAINAMIAATVEETKAYHTEFGSGINYLTYTINGSFSNVLSIGLFSADHDYNSRQDYLNINLNDGSLLKLSDVLCAQADLQSLVRTAFYETLTRYNLAAQYWEEISSPDENELYKTVRNYLAEEEPQFAFSPTELYFYYGDYAASVVMEDHAEDIAIYHRFLSEESLFERDDIGYKNIFTCAQISEGFAQREFGFGGDNFWYDIAMDEIYRDAEIPASVYEQVDALGADLYDGLMAEVETLRQMALDHPDRAYILLAAPNVYLYSGSEYFGGYWEMTPSKAVTVNENYVLYEMDFDLFETKYREILVRTYRDNPWYLFYVGMDEYIDGEDITITKRNSDELRLYESGETLTVENVFVDGYDYDTQIRTQAKYDLMSNYYYSLEEAEQLAQTVVYRLAGTGIEVRLPGWGDDQYMWMALDTFNRDNLTIFQ